MSAHVTKLADMQPTAQEAEHLISLVDPLLKYLGCERCQGIGTPLGRLAVSLLDIRHTLGQLRNPPEDR